MPYNKRQLITAVALTVIAAVIVIAVYVSLLQQNQSEIEIESMNVIINNASGNGGFSLARMSQEVLSANATFALRLTSNSLVPQSVRNVSVLTQGFTLLSTAEQLPLVVDNGGSLTLNLKAPDSQFKGNLTILLKALPLSQNGEGIAISNVAVQTLFKTVTFMRVENIGNSTVNLASINLVRSGGIVVNSTNVTAPAQLPNAIVDYQVNLSYLSANLTETYYLVAITTNGVNATSNAFWLDCNCQGD
ncbi:MAG: hypothetical protein LUP94_02090 [Candidatus Methanomethylicus sp.]|nr:hypothetical protein [Candidatus Methanomethylicus sp.]